MPDRPSISDSDAAVTAGSDVLDERALARLNELDPDGTRGFVFKVLATYVESLQRHQASIAQAMQAQDLKALASVAHTLKSSSASVGATALSEACARCEQMARTGNTEVFAAPAADLRAQAEAALAAVRAILAR